MLLDSGNLPVVVEPEVLRKQFDVLSAMRRPAMDSGTMTNPTSIPRRAGGPGGSAAGVNGPGSRSVRRGGRMRPCGWTRSTALLPGAVRYHVRRVAGPCQQVELEQRDCESSRANRLASAACCTSCEETPVPPKLTWREPRSRQESPPDLVESPGRVPVRPRARSHGTGLGIRPHGSRRPHR